jgi:hypothetical protein
MSPWLHALIEVKTNCRWAISCWRITDCEGKTSTFASNNLRIMHGHLCHYQDEGVDR